MTVGIARVERGEGAEAPGLADVVELLAEARADDLEHRLRVEAAAPEHADERLEERRVREVALHRAGDARVLHLDGDLAPVLEPRAVHLADGGAGEGGVVPLGEEACRSGAWSSSSTSMRMACGDERGAWARSALREASNAGACCSGTSPST